MENINDVFARKNEQGNYDLLYLDGTAVTRISDAIKPVVWPVDCDLSGYYDHPEGIVLTLEDVKKLGVEIEK